MIIGDNEFSSFTNLKTELKVSTGTIYHHLDTLSQLIEQRDDKKYYLTDLGNHAYSSLKNNVSSIASPGRTIRDSSSLLLKGLLHVTPKRFINYDKANRIYTIILSISVLALGAIFCGLSGLYPVFLFFGESIQNVEIMELFQQILFSIFFILNYLLFSGIIEGIIRLIFKNKENYKQFFIVFPLIFLPINIYLILHFIFLVSGLLSLPVVAVINIILLILLQAWSLWILTYILNTIKGVKIEYSLIIALLLHYASFSAILFAPKPISVIDSASPALG